MSGYPRKGISLWKLERITLKSVAAKVMCKVLMQRISDGIDAKLRKEQAGLRRGRSTIEQMFVLRKIVEQTI